MASQRKYYGWKPDLPDKRDRAFIPKLMPLPKKIDLRHFFSPVENQQTLGSCTANALAGNLEYLELKDKIPFEDKSRLFIYYNERVIENSVNFDDGAMLRDGIKSLASHGCCSEKEWPYVPDKFSVKPPESCYVEALNHQILSYERLHSIHDMKACLATGFPFVFGFSVYSSFDDIGSDGMMRIPDLHKETMDGGHAVCAAGYDDDVSCFIVRNSWGTNWGMDGYFMMPYQIISRGFCADFWTIKRQEG